MSYIAMSFNHIRAVTAWVEAHRGRAHLDLLSFELEVKALHRYFHLQPQFLASVEGRLGHVGQMSADVTGFIGWLPYRPISFDLSTDKLVFKQCLSKMGLPTPSVWDTPEEATADFILKRSVGSFGYDMSGPFKAHSSVDPSIVVSSIGRPSGGAEAGIVYVEEFVFGRNLKVWCWGQHAFHAHLHAYPTALGDGGRTAEELISSLMAKAGHSFETSPDRPYIEQSLRYQGIAIDRVVETEREFWLDFRYGRRFVAPEPPAANDSALPSMEPHVRRQIDLAAVQISAELERQLQVPVLYSLDGVVDKSGRIAWLEINSNPVFPPTGYPYMFSTLFDVPVPEYASASLPADTHTPTLFPSAELDLGGGAR